MTASTGHPGTALVESVLADVLQDPSAATLLVVAHRDPALLTLAADAAGAEGARLVGAVPGHLEGDRETARRPLDLEEPRWNDVLADVVVLEPEPNHWTTSRLLEAACAAGSPKLVAVLLPDAPVLADRDAYPAGSAVPALKRHPSAIGGVPDDVAAAVEATWHYASSAGGPRNGVRAAVLDFVAAGAGDWTTAERGAVVWLVGRDASPALREQVERHTAPAPEPPAPDTPAATIESAVAEPAAETAPEPAAPEAPTSPEPAVAEPAPEPAATTTEAETLLERRTRQLRNADSEILKLKEQRHRLRGRVEEIGRLQERIAELDRRHAREIAERDELVQRVELRLRAAIGWQAALRGEGDRLRAEVRELRAALERSRADAERGERAHDALRALAAEALAADAVAAGEAG